MRVQNPLSLIKSSLRERAIISTKIEPRIFSINFLCGLSVCSQMKSEDLSWAWQSSSYCTLVRVCFSLFSHISWLNLKHLVLATTTGKPLLGQFYDEMAQNLSPLLFCLPLPPCCHLIANIFLNGGGGRVWEGPTQVSTHWMCCWQTGRRVLARAASHRWDWQASKQQVHGREKWLKNTDRTEGRASVRSEVHFVWVGAGRLSMAWRTRERAKKKWRLFVV